MSRDRRQRSKQRLRRRAGEGAGELVRADVPGALDHASGDVDEFDAALLRGAGGVPVPEADVEHAEASTERAPASVTEPAQGGDSGREDGGNGAVGNGGGDEGGSRSVATREPARPPEPRGSIFARAAAFLRASWAELQRVQWPDRPEVFQATAVVMGFVAVMGVYLGVADWVAQKIINFVL